MARSILEQPRLENARRLVTLALCTALLATDAAAQDAPRRVVRVRVADTAGFAVPGAEVSVVRGLNEVRASGLTDNAGNRLLLVPADTGVLHLVARKLGYRRAERFFRAETADTLSFTFRLAPVTQTLGRVEITAREDTRRRRLYIDAEAIANSDRPLFTGVDIIEKLRPDMIWGMGGPPSRGVKICDKIQNVWINGVRITQAPVWAEEIAAARLPSPGLVARGRGASSRAALANALRLLNYRVPLGPASVLTAIKPEHIAEITYNDCFETAVKANLGANAAFVVLKPGIAYSPDFGSYVVGAEAPLRTHAPAAPAPFASSARLASYRFRLLGLYDDASGQPIADAEVTDTVSGTTGRTSDTGTISLAFLPDGGSIVRIRKLGYEELMLKVAISPSDTAPITLTARPVPKP